MKLFWFMDEPDGHRWTVIAALDEEIAWKLLSERSYSNKDGHEKMDLQEAHEKFSLAAITDIDETRQGEVANIFPLEVYFSIKGTPGGEISMLTNH